jgi:N-acetylneuraminate synthase
VAAGEQLTLENLRIVRPGNGLEPKHLDLVLGRQLRKARPKGTPVSWDLLLADA